MLSYVTNPPRMIFIIVVLTLVVSMISCNDEEFIGSCMGPLGKTCSDYLGKKNSADETIAQTFCITATQGFSALSSEPCPSEGVVGSCPFHLEDSETGDTILKGVTYYYTQNIVINCSGDTNPE